jgi:tripartite-type tricarboxylate transporter receptor subunit TctC
MQRHQHYQIWHVAAILGFCLSLSSGALAQANNTIKIVVPYAPGGPADSMSRLLAEQIGQANGVTVIVENRPGAGTVIGTDAVSRSAPDGKTLLIVSNSFIINPHLRKLNYDPLTSFDPICNLVQSPGIFAVSSNAPYHTLKELLADSRARPGGLTMAASGPATGFHVGFEQLKIAANVNITFVPFNGSAPAVNALLGEHVASAFADYMVVAEQLKAGTLRALATSSSTRIEALPDVPTVAESGYKDYQAEIWYGIVARASTPEGTRSQLEKWFTGALQESKLRAKLIAIGLYPVSSCGADFGALMRAKFDAYGRVIRDAGIKE